MLRSVINFIFGKSAYSTVAGIAQSSVVTVATVAATGNVSPEALAGAAVAGAATGIIAAAARAHGEE